MVKKTIPSVVGVWTFSETTQYGGISARHLYDLMFSGGIQYSLQTGVFCLTSLRKGKVSVI